MGIRRFCIPAAAIAALAVTACGSSSGSAGTSGAATTSTSPAVHGSTSKASAPSNTSGSQGHKGRACDNWKTAAADSSSFQQMLVGPDGDLCGDGTEPTSVVSGSLKVVFDHDLDDTVPGTTSPLTDSTSKLGLSWSRWDCVSAPGGIAPPAGALLDTNTAVLVGYLSVYVTNNSNTPESPDLTVEFYSGSNRISRRNLGGAPLTGSSGGGFGLEIPAHATSQIKVYAAVPRTGIVFNTCQIRDFTLLNNISSGIYHPW